MKAGDVYKRIGSWTVYIRYKGVWDFDDLYKSMADWFKHRKYYFHEVYTKHKKNGPYGVDSQFKWSGVRNEEDYVNYQIDVFMKTYDTHDIIVKQKNGKKKTFTKGRLWIEFSQSINYDYQGNWESSAFYARLRNFYQNYIVYKRLEGYWWDQMYYREMHKLHRLVKERLKMETRDYEHEYFTGVHR